MDNITKGMVDTVEPQLRRLGDKTNDTSIQISKFKDAVQTEEENNEKPNKRKKKETREVTGSGSAGQFSAPLFTQSSSEETPNLPKVKTVKEGLGGEATEATATGASTGQYSTPGWVAKNKKNWRGRAKTQIPGGQFVTIKKKCQTFPYCNQGDINALKLSENSIIDNAIKNVSKKLGVTETVIKSILLHELEEKRNK